MKDVLQRTDEIPVTLLVAIAYVTMAFLMDPGNPTPAQLHQHGWLLPTLVSDGEPWRLLTCAFLHGGWLHLGFNTYILLGFAPSLERTIGSARMAAVYLISALGGSLAVCLVNSPFQPVVGGSGALFGVFGAIVALQMRQSRSTLGFLDYDGPRRILSLIVINLLFGAFMPMISNTAHIGGLVAGFGFTYLFLTTIRETDKSMPAWRLASAALTTSLLFYALYPAARWDWLWHQAQSTQDVGRRERLLLAGARSLFDTTDVSDYNVQSLELTMNMFKGKLEKLRKQ